ncbi:VOC family protein [Streptomyces sp. P38-E01]|uniref:VOC family protein n=1 Tax=Streptomyces tardus TaxID=2780544 RepID=A0A949N6J2_9ACTN|nr:VOC family protein [Streptomyces tardus]MBU7599122.1 VOC family protein [Streptomyces tardus]
MNGAPSFFELGVEDADKARSFYGDLFGWNLPPGPSEGGYRINTPTIPGGVHGGDSGASPYIFFQVDDMDWALLRVQQLGGTVQEVDLGGDEESVAKHGRFKLCVDNQGSPFGLHQPPAAAS